MAINWEEYNKFRKWVSDNYDWVQAYNVNQFNYLNSPYYQEFLAGRKAKTSKGVITSWGELTPEEREEMSTGNNPEEKGYPAPEGSEWYIMEIDRTTLEPKWDIRPITTEVSPAGYKPTKEEEARQWRIGVGLEPAVTGEVPIEPRTELDLNRASQAWDEDRNRWVEQYMGQNDWVRAYFAQNQPNPFEQQRVTGQWQQAGAGLKYGVIPELEKAIGETLPKQEAFSRWAEQQPPPTGQFGATTGGLPFAREKIIEAGRALEEATGGVVSDEYLKAKKNLLAAEEGLVKVMKGIQQTEVSQAAARPTGLPAPSWAAQMLGTSPGQQISPTAQIKTPGFGQAQAMSPQRWAEIASLERYLGQPAGTTQQQVNIMRPEAPRGAGYGRWTPPQQRV